MKNTLKLNHAERTIVMDKTFARFAADTMSAEFAIPDFTLERIICNSSSENTPAIFRNADDIASSSPLRQSMGRTISSVEGR